MGDNVLRREKSQKWRAIAVSFISSQVLESSYALPVAAGQKMDLQQGGQQIMGLKEQLEELAAQSKTKLPEPAAAVMRQSLEDLKQSGIVNQALKEGEHAPNFALTNATGKTVRLKQLLNKGPVVVSFYRGGWCPYCNLTLRALEKSLPEIQAEGATLVAISPELPDGSLSTVEKDRLTFEVLSDSGNKVARQFGIVYQLSPELVKLYQGFGINLAQSNGDGSNELPLAATFVISTNGTIAYAFADADYKKRMEPSDIVAVLKRIAGKGIVESKP